MKNPTPIESRRVTQLGGECCTAYCDERSRERNRFCRASARNLRATTDSASLKTIQNAPPARRIRTVDLTGYLVRWQIEGTAVSAWRGEVGPSTQRKFSRVEDDTPSVRHESLMDAPGARNRPGLQPPWQRRGGDQTRPWQHGWVLSRRFFAIHSQSMLQVNGFAEAAAYRAKSFGGKRSSEMQHASHKTERA